MRGIKKLAAPSKSATRGCCLPEYGAGYDYEFVLTTPTKNFVLHPRK